jgi:microcystin-dependent protein
MSEPYIGEIMLFGGNFPPRGWAFCDGQTVFISQNQALFSLLGTIYGGDGQSTFRLPDMRGRAPISMGTGPGLTPRTIGSRGGQENVQLAGSQLGSHKHGLFASTDEAVSAAPVIPEDFPDPAEPQVLADTNVALYAHGTPDTAAFALGNTGNSGAHNNMGPYQVVNYCIALVGLFPSEN